MLALIDLPSGIGAWRGNKRAARQDMGVGAAGSSQVERVVAIARLLLKKCGAPLPGRYVSVIAVFPLQYIDVGVDLSNDIIRVVGQRCRAVKPANDFDVVVVC